MCCKYDRWLWGGKLVGKIRQKQGNFVEIPGFEPGQTEPKSVVLPLHHISITVNWPQMYIIFAKPSNYLFPLKKSLIRLAHSSASTPETTEVLGWSSDGE